jgi:hypothetical protein
VSVWNRDALKFHRVTPVCQTLRRAHFEAGFPRPLARTTYEARRRVAPRSHWGSRRHHRRACGNLFPAGHGTLGGSRVRAAIDSALAGARLSGTVKLATIPYACRAPIDTGAFLGFPDFSLSRSRRFTPLGSRLFIPVALFALLGSAVTIGWLLVRGADEKKWHGMAATSSSSIRR